MKIIIDILNDLKQKNSKYACDIETLRRYISCYKIFEYENGVVNMFNGDINELVSNMIGIRHNCVPA